MNHTTDLYRVLDVYVTMMTSSNEEQYSIIVSKLEANAYDDCYECFIDIVNLHSSSEPWKSSDVHEETIRSLLKKAKKRFPRAEIFEYDKVLEWENRLSSAFYSRPPI